MNLDAAKNLALELMEQHGLLIEKWFFEWSRSKKVAGSCTYRIKRIVLSKPLTELSDEKDVRDTILHEIAHALTPNHGHDWIWQRKAKEIGCNGQRCYGGNECSIIIAHNKIAKYKAVCINGHENFCNRLPKGKHSCGKCSRRFDEKFLFNYVLNV